MITLDDDERMLMEQQIEIYRHLTEDWGLRANVTELAAAVHVIQGFIVQHMLGRLAPDDWAGWYQE